LFLQNPWQKWAGIVHLEYVYLTLLFLLGTHLLCLTVDLIGLYVALELQSFSIVVLCRMNYVRLHAIEAGMKYFLLRAFSSSLLLLGVTLIYSQTGHTDLSSIQELLTVLCCSTPDPYHPPYGGGGTPHRGYVGGETGDLLPMLGLWLIGLGLLWKLA